MLNFKVALYPCWFLTPKWQGHRMFFNFPLHMCVCVWYRAFQRRAQGSGPLPGSKSDTIWGNVLKFVLFVYLHFIYSFFFFQVLYLDPQLQQNEIKVMGVFPWACPLMILQWLIQATASETAKGSHLKKLIIYLSWVALGLPCCSQAFCSCSEWGLLFIAVASLVAGHRL